jgi:nicotinate-nucleotide pyrophosphorylase (carboxylating)
MAIRPGKAERDNLRRLLEMAREEDLGSGDVSGELLPAGAAVGGRFVAREALVFCGGAFLGEVADAYAGGIRTTLAAAEGQAVAPRALLAEWAGPARAVLAAERVALNFLQRLSGIATLTRAYVEAASATGAAIYDTRKTAPAWRALEKYAVRAGGGRNHRMGLWDAVMLKDNHLAVLAAGEAGPASLAARLTEARERLPADGFVEIEVDTLEQLAEALKLPVDVVLLDNMPPDQLRRAVAMRDEAGLRGRLALEASGRVTLDNLRAVGETGVERIAVGALTHSAPAADIALDIRTH